MTTASTSSAPENQLIGAPNWRRFAALLYDSFIILALSFGYGAVMTAVGATFGSANQEDYTPMFSSPLFGIGWLLVIASFYWIFWRRFGQTIGMKTWHLKLVSSADESLAEKVSWQQCFLRSIFGVIAFFGLGFGYFFRWLNPLGDCWHDKVSKTRVIVTKKKKK